MSDNSCLDRSVLCLQVVRRPPRAAQQRPNAGPSARQPLDLADLSCDRLFTLELGLVERVSGVAACLEVGAVRHEAGRRGKGDEPGGGKRDQFAVLAEYDRETAKTQERECTDGGLHVADHA